MAESSLHEVNTSIFVQIVDNLPREMICLIVSHLSVSYLKTFRLACFQYKYLYDHFYDVVTEEIKKRCVLNFNLSGIDDHPFILSKTLTSYYSVVMKSSFMISLKLPAAGKTVTYIDTERRLIELVNECYHRITRITAHTEVSNNLVQAILPKSTLEFLDLYKVEFKEFQCNILSKLTEIKLSTCSGKIGLKSLFAGAICLKKLSLSWMEIDSDVATSATSSNNLKELDLWECTGEISLLLTLAAPTILKLRLCTIDMDTSVQNPFTKLQVFMLSTGPVPSDDEIEISASPLLTRPGKLSEFGTELKEKLKEREYGDDYECYYDFEDVDVPDYGYDDLAELYY